MWKDFQREMDGVVDFSFHPLSFFGPVDRVILMMLFSNRRLALSNAGGKRDMTWLFPAWGRKENAVGFFFG